MARRELPLQTVTHDAIGQPTATNDLARGILAGSNWRNVNTSKWYWCADHTNDSAVWKEMVFADDIEGIITPIISGMTDKSFGGLKLSSATSTTGIALNTFKRMMGTTIEYAEVVNFDQTGNNQLKYIGTNAIKCKMLAFATGKVSFSTGANFQLTVARNGTPITGMAQTDSVGSVLLGALSTMAIPLQCLDTLTVNPDDIFEIQVTSSSHTSLSIANAGLFIKQL